ncbi:polyprenyl diphosphate synthase [Thalassotalea mangrovi]|uniref:Ditrans,polycis-undecaprenyl-diphosphate synthase ((2E,6E)-farnesyl-diphosphate specific) n=1 Tax=Thalassotalea mangrovi TaxID=2572245 RepID=A0A4U1B344_9GAMM|nr:polyprenyl diphosphate synthase [Thalassotalea mangrovi]TKB44132.1 di-trans,poly-cis-decaprenylcistransferase [Thalassotalea mangrovi]
MSVPQHVAIIMDGNGRWAQRQGKGRVAGHRAGVETVRSTVTTARELGIKALTLFAFSSENWKRPPEEVSVLMDLFMFVLTREVNRLHKHNIRFQLIGDKQRFSQKLQEKIIEAEQLTKNNDAMVLSVAANYGGRWDITQACQKIAQQAVNGQISLDAINEQMLNNHIQLSQLPELDLLVRTGGDYRISNFLLWQAAYAEFFFTEKLWPEFDADAFKQALEAFTQRERRFGQTGEQVRGI